MRLDGPTALVWPDREEEAGDGQRVGEHLHLLALAQQRGVDPPAYAGAVGPLRILKPRHTENKFI